MANTRIQKQMTELVGNFIGLWNRYYTLYLEGISQQDITSEKENEFLKFQGTMVEQLVKVLEFDPKPRFNVHDRVMTVIHDVVSLDLYIKMSEFQIKRTKQQWQDAMNELEKLYRFCDTYDPKIDKVKRITEVKRVNPFWDPTSGGMRSTLRRIAVAPVTFFQGLKPGYPPEGIGRFIFLTFFIPAVVLLVIIFIANFETVKIIGTNVCIEAKLLTEGESGLVPSLIRAAAVFMGLMVIALILSTILSLLLNVFSTFMHIGFKITGGKGNYQDTYKTVGYGIAPFITLIIAPYIVILQIIGASKTHRYPFPLAIIGWIIGVVLFTVIVFTVAGAALYFTDNVPAAGEYAYVIEDDTDIMSSILIPKHTVNRGEWLPFIKEKTARKEGVSHDVYEIKYKDGEWLVEQDEVEIRTFSWTSMPMYIIDRAGISIHSARRFLNRIIEKYSAEMVPAL